MDKIRVLIAKPGLDGHDRGALVISQALRDKGMEVIYTGLRQSPKQIVQAAIQEDVDVIGLSSLSGAHNVLFPKVIEELNASDAGDILVFGGGVIPHEDIRNLEKMGIRKIFTPGTKMDTISSFIERAVREAQGEEETILEPPTGVDHVGIAVQSIEESLPFYQGHLHLHVEQITEVPKQGVRVAFISAGNIRLELLEPLNPDSPVQRFIDKNGEGLHHLAFGVTSLPERLIQLKHEGVPLINETPVTGAMGHPIAFLHPKANSGTLVELVDIEHGEQKEDV